MGTSSLVKVKQQKRDTLFFDRYEFSATAHIPEAFVLRHRDHSIMDGVLARRRDWGRRVSSQPGSWLWSRVEISDKDIENLHTVLDWILAEEGVKTTVTGDSIYVYAQDLAQLNRFVVLPGIKFPRIIQAVLKGDPAAVNLRQSEYQYRTYFRWTSLTTAQKQNLRSLLGNQTDIRLSPSLKHWLKDNKNLHLWEHHFLDHSDSGILTMLALSLGRVIKKTVPIKIY